MESLYIDGHSRGLITTWSSTLNKIDSRKLDSVLETKLHDQEKGITFTLLNMYGPIYDRNIFWEKLSMEGALNQPNMILGGL